MSLVTLNGVAFDYAGEPLLRDVSFAVERGDRWGVVGRNGTGKTTLLQLIAGSLHPVAGSIARESGLRVTLLDQHRVFEDGVTVREAASSPFADLLALERSLERQAAKLESDASPAALATYDRDLQRFERDGGHTFRSRVDAVLEGLGFATEQARAQRIESLSGGERGRVGLARQLAAPGDILLLDEPTNHLDLETTRWLEDWLVASRATALVISHDRAFLDRLADHVLHLEAGTAVPYDAGYSGFVEFRNERRKVQQKAYEQQRRKIAADEDYIRRNIAGQKTKQAQSRRGRLARLPRLSPPPTEDGAMGLRLKADARGGDQVLIADGVGIEIGGRTLFNDFTARVKRGEVVGVVGPNGSGKTSLLGLIAGEREPDSGGLRLGHGIAVAHYRQDLGQIPVEKSLFATISDLRPKWQRGQVQSHLGRFGFSGEEVQRIVGSLSGGEQARLALAMIVLSGDAEGGSVSANLLLFDEPTNHLDVESIEALEDAIEAFDGTVFLVSHDRALLETLTTRTWALYDQRIEDYPGSFADWALVRSEREQKEQAEARLAEQETRRQEKAKARRAHEERQAKASARFQARRAVEAAESRAHELEVKVAALEARLQDASLYTTATSVAEAAALQRDLLEVKDALDLALEDWAAAAERLATVEDSTD